MTFNPDNPKEENKTLEEFNLNPTLIKCLLLDNFGVWGKASLRYENFKFKCNYCEAKKGIELWTNLEGTEIYILKDVKIKWGEDKNNEKQYKRKRLINFNGKKN